MKGITLSVLILFLALDVCFSQTGYVIKESCDERIKMAVLNDECLDTTRFQCNEGVVEESYCIKALYKRSSYPESQACEGEDDFISRCEEKIDFDEEEYCTIYFYEEIDCSTEPVGQVTMKTGQCLYTGFKHFLLFNDGDYIHFFFGQDTCTDSVKYTAKLENGISTCQDIGGDQYYKFNCKSKNDKNYKYLKIEHRTPDEEVVKEEIIHNQLTCDSDSYEPKTIIKFFTGYTVKILQEDCEDEIELTQISEAPAHFCETQTCQYATNVLSTRVGSYLFSRYNSIEDCENNGSPITSLIFFGSDKACDILDDSINIIKISETHYNYFPSCDEPDGEEFEFGKCIAMDNFKVEKIDVPNLFNYVTCKMDICSLNNDVIIDEVIEVNIHLNIKKSALIKLNVLSEKGFNVVDDGFIKISGGVLEFEITPEMIEELKQKLDEDDTYEYTIISGAYSGRFDDIEIKKDPSSCEDVSGELNYDSPTTMTATFKVEDCSSKLKWWIILIICLGIVIVAGVIVFFVIRNNKACRGRFLPYQT